jgi:hypothetical protein
MNIDPGTFGLHIEGGTDSITKDIVGCILHLEREGLIPEKRNDPTITDRSFLKSPAQERKETLLSSWSRYFRIQDWGELTKDLREVLGDA